ncbi:MAG: ATP-binding cassette domain-containing protein, partial [Chloroflexi bacterium]|nr:ATP-binding cassette domain-containing protein [Chloroflexota bacterium]
MIQSPAAVKVRIEGIQKSYGTGPSAMVAVQDVSLNVVTNSFVCLLGPSGCGKSTLLNMLAGFVTPTAGRMSIDGQ